MMLKEGKLNILIDGQFGSTGKGLVASYIGWYNHVDLAITNASMNAGHTFYINDSKYVTKHLPIIGILNKRSTIYLCAGAIINPEFLLKELETFDIDPNRICIHPRAAIIEQQDREHEAEGSVKKIASTQSGVGSALIRKIDRKAKLAGDTPLIKHMVKELDVSWLLDQGVIAGMEVPQGFSLSINSGYSYPHCTSREITVSAAMSDAQLHPSYLGNVFVVIRTFPIRVGHIIEDGVMVGDSGPFYPDSKEISWEKLGVEKEYTTNTKRVRRIATFSMIEYKKMLKMFHPDYVFLNFANYLSLKELQKLLKKLREVTHVCVGPRIEDIMLRCEVPNSKPRNLSLKTRRAINADITI
jgi:adenylosuccinate synthase